MYSLLARVGGNLTSHGFSTLAGAGLSYAAGVMAVGAGTGITANANDIAVTIPLTDGDKGDITVSSSGTVFTIDAATITPAKLAVVTNSIAANFSIFVDITAGAGGSADDVTVYNVNAPFAFRILKVFPYITTTVGGATIQARSASGGGGSALSSQFNADVATEDPVIAASITSTSTVAANGSIFIRRSDSGIAGQFVFLCVPV